MDWKRLALGIFTALAMLVLTYVLPRGGALREASLVQFPMTVGVCDLRAAIREIEITRRPACEKAVS
jgi:hypothetical protein